MAEVVAFESQEALLDAEIQTEVDRIRAAGLGKLPIAGSRIVASSIRKIEGSYDVSRAKKDTDNAIDLLYIAYNTTPQQEGEIRVLISDILDKLIKAQQSSDRSMKGAMRTASTLAHYLGEHYEDWLEVVKENDQDATKVFIKDDLVAMVEKIKADAVQTRDNLLKIAGAYDEIIKDTAKATAVSEVALGRRIENRAAVEKEIRDSTATRLKLESLVSDLTEEVKKYEQKARDYEKRAETAEERAFILSIVQIGAQMIASVVPAIAMAAGGPESMMASSALGALNSHAGGSQGGSEGGKDNTAEIIKKKEEIAEQQQQLATSEDKQQKLKAEIKILEGQRDKDGGKGEGGGAARTTGASGAADSAAGGAGTTGAAGAAGETEPTPDATGATGGVAEITDPGPGDGAESALERRIRGRKDALEKEEVKGAGIKAALAALQAALEKLSEGLGKLSEAQQKQANDLRGLQMRMLDRAEEFEKARRTQSAELVKIKALLVGQRTEEETIILAIRSLNMSLSAFKRAKEIVEEIAYFFRSFADFMEGVSDEATAQVGILDDAKETETMRQTRFARLVRSIDEFFIRQAAEWLAAHDVSDRFSKTFADGWSKLNRLKGSYIVGEELNGYLQIASVTLGQIAEERDNAAKRKIASLETYREKLRESA